jgi:hypothetical protein
MTISTYQQIFAIHAMQPKVTTMSPNQGVMFSIISEASLLHVKSQLL